jgi:uncharacterized protein
LPERESGGYDEWIMPFLLRNIVLDLDEPEEILTERAAERLGVPPTAIRNYAIVRRSIDARRGQIKFNYHLEIALDVSRSREHAQVRKLRPDQAIWLIPDQPDEQVPGHAPLENRPVIIGFGPAGMFAALRLAESGYRPVVLERGRDVRRRHRDIMQRFYRERDFDETSNLLFGEGGAGTYSDGKLYTRIHDPLCRYVLEVFYRHGADPEILIDARPHIGSDRLPTICTRIREHIESLGGEIRFESRVEDIELHDGRLTKLRIVSTGSAAKEEWIPVGPVILAVGHSARDTIRMLSRRGVKLVPKPFQIGVRIEHPQDMVDSWQYGPAAGHRRLDSAEYHVVAKRAAGAQGDAFSFCMCPGGVILPTNESAGLIATNGASKSRRSGPFANSGLVITIDPARMREEFSRTLGALKGCDATGLGGAAGSLSTSLQQALDDLSRSMDSTASVALAGMAYQEYWERLAFGMTDATYRVPCQRANDFLDHRRSDGQLETSYPLGGAWCTLADTIPQAAADALLRSLPMLESRMKGFASRDAIITAPETRASAPIRIPRDPDTRESVSTPGLYPVGEGAGYAGGIVSAAVDGIKTADRLIAHYAPPR